MKYNLHNEINILAVALNLLFCCFRKTKMFQTKILRSRTANSSNLRIIELEVPAETGNKFERIQLTSYQNKRNGQATTTEIIEPKCIYKCNHRSPIPLI